MVVLGRVPDTDEFRDLKRHPENITYPEILVVRFDAPLVFANSHMVKHDILDAVEEAPDLGLVVLDMESSPMLDITASDMLGDLDDILDERGVKFRLANLMGEGRDMLRAIYPQKRVGHIDPITTVHGIVDDWLAGGKGECRAEDIEEQEAEGA
jgi:MFS superfamily sulfate permease-like transporter